ncbi:unnamed protein product, partial [Prorocentrum cordatum]
VPADGSSSPGSALGARVRVRGGWAVPAAGAPAVPAGARRIRPWPMVELEGGAELSGQSDDGDDIARFERQCAARAKAEGLVASGYGDEREGDKSDEEDEPDERLQRARLAAGTGPPPSGESEWQQRCSLLQELRGMPKT